MAGKHGNQCERILKYLTDFKTITSAEAMSELGVYRLASRITDLKKQGYSIKKETVKAKNRYGEIVHFAQYSLEEYKGVAQ
jgi:hypothetical protein